MRTVADFKRALQPGVRVTLLDAPWFPSANGIAREVVRVQTTKFSLRTTRADGSQVESWCDYPKARDATFDGDLVRFPRFSDSPEIGSMTYRIESTEGEAQ